LMTRCVRRAGHAGWRGQNAGAGAETALTQEQGDFP
jgi:hypothetical protein